MKQSTFRSVFLTLFISLAGAAFFFGWFVTRGVREQARQTDTELRSVAWAIMSYSAATGNMPTSSDALNAFITSHAECLVAPRREGDWPSTLQIAEASDNPADIASFISDRIEVIWPPKGNLAPILQVRGRPSGIGTIEKVNEWLQQWNKAAEISTHK